MPKAKRKRALRVPRTLTKKTAVRCTDGPWRGEQIRLTEARSTGILFLANKDGFWYGRYVTSGFETVRWESHNAEAPQMIENIMTSNDKRARRRILSMMQENKHLQKLMVQSINQLTD